MRRAAVAAVAIVVALAGSAALHTQATAQQGDPHGKHVLLISVDGLHASDLSTWISEHPDSNLARLATEGTTYANASTTMPSDSFPGLLSLVTGGTPKTTGVFYDDTYTRNFWAAGSNCQGKPGTETMYAENLDKTDAGGNIPLYTSIDPAKLPLSIVNGKCVPIYPHSFLQTNTIFNVADAAHLYTAWSDKHPAYDIVNGPSGDGVNDLFTPEINNVNDPTTISVQATAAYDQLKVRAVLNEIDGKTANGKDDAPVPAIFGMNFQAVSVGQKLVDPVKSCQRNPGPNCDPNYFPGGYEPGTLAFTPQLREALRFVDGAIGSMADELQEKGLFDSTQIIITAKHGQSPIDPSRLAKIGDQVTALLTNAGIAVAQTTSDDIALVWLKDQSQTAAAVKVLQNDKKGANTARIDYVLSGDALADKFGNPLTNNRTPDLIVQPIAGTIYTHSAAKVAEHGGFAEDDTHVAMLVVNGADKSPWTPSRGSTVSRPVTTTQVAPTILDFLGLDPQALKSVRLEGTQVLPRQ